MTGAALNVVMLSDLEDQGGAAVAASRLATGLTRAGHRVTRIVYFESTRPQPWETIRLDLGRNSGRAVRLLPNRTRPAVRRILLRRRLRAILDRLEPDLINIHNLHGAIPAGWGLGLVVECSETAPVVWTMHDMWSFTGRCAYSWDCDLFRSGCDHSCPTPNEHPTLPPAMISSAWRYRADVMGSMGNLVAVSPSRWLQGEAESGLWRSNRVKYIPYGLPLENFRPIDQNAARTALGIETTRPLLLICAADWRERRKGAQVLEDALHHLPPGSVCLLTLGAGRIEMDHQENHSLGFVEDERLKVLAYSAADLFVHPAQVDNLPNVVIEAIACGTPVVGLPIGGVPDMVVPGVTGWLAGASNGEALADAITGALAGREEWSRLRLSCRSYAEQHYDDRVQAERYTDLFRRLMNRGEGL